MMGITTMLAEMFGNQETVEAVKSCIGETIAGVRLDEATDSLLLQFDGGRTLALSDEGQCCCESSDR